MKHLALLVPFTCIWMLANGQGLESKVFGRWQVVRTNIILGGLEEDKELLWNSCLCDEIVITASTVRLATTSVCGILEPLDDLQIKYFGILDAKASRGSLLPYRFNLYTFEAHHVSSMAVFNIAGAFEEDLDSIWLYAVHENLIIVRIGDLLFHLRRFGN